MGQRIVIDPVTRIEGHAKITIQLDDDGQVADARFHVAEFRGFERFCDGRPLWEMAGITARVCGICPVSHLIASAKAGDQIMAVTPPPAAEKLRRLMNLAQIVQSHALSFFHLSSPDLMLGFDSDPARRNIFGLIAADRELARGGIRLRQFGQEIIERLGGKKIHPAWSVPGGVREPLTEAGRDAHPRPHPRGAGHRRSTPWAASRACWISIRRRPRTSATSRRCSWAWSATTAPGSTTTARSASSTRRAGSSPTASTRSGTREFIGEATQHDSYLKFPYYKPLGYPDGDLPGRAAGPPQRLRPDADPAGRRELREYRDRFGTATSSFLYHYARLIEILAGVEGIALAIEDPDVLSDRLRAHAGINQLEGVGVSEAPRGTLFHHYQVDENGLMKRST